ncbi:hypothetical protein C0J52_14240, partial [Blattella germanica]
EPKESYVQLNNAAYRILLLNALDADLSLLQPGFNPRLIHMRFVQDKTLLASLIKPTLSMDSK